MAKTKTLISFAVSAKLICVFVFAYAKIRFSHNEAQITSSMLWGGRAVHMSVGGGGGVSCMFYNGDVRSIGGTK